MKPASGVVVALLLAVACTLACTAPGPPLHPPADADVGSEERRTEGDVRSADAPIEIQLFDLLDVHDGLEVAEVDAGKVDADASDAPDVCSPKCAGQQCGPDGCGGSCGECAWGYDCSSGEGQHLCLADCVVLCTDKECGPAGTYDECDCGQCADSNICTDDLCVDGVCLFEPNVATCDDGNPCTAPDLCGEGACTGELLPLEQLDVEKCLCESDEDCAPLEDNDVCNGTLHCDLAAQTTVCQVAAETIPDCTDGNPCTDDACDAKEGCLFLPDDGNVCADADACNGKESCVDGACTAGVPLDCDDGDKCTDDACDSTQGCVHDLATGLCDDGLTCTEDLCSDNACTNDILPDYCVLEGDCVPAATVKADNACQHCQPGAEQEQWTALADGTACGEGKVCYEGSCCGAEANCQAVECGDDGCGGSCGECPCGHQCANGTCVFVACDGKVCGGDGCGGSCGECPESPWIVCTQAGQCADVCIPNCDGKECGSPARPIVRTFAPTAFATRISVRTAATAPKTAVNAAATTSAKCCLVKRLKPVLRTALPAFVETASAKRMRGRTA